MNIKRRITLAIILILLCLSIGTIGYSTFEGWNIFDSIYMTVITLATVGYEETHPLSQQGRIFTVFLIIMGTGTLVYGVSVITAFIVEGELRDILRRRRMEKDIFNLKNHYIICGGGKTGKYIIHEFLKMKENFVVIEKNKDQISWLEEYHILYINGDATNDEILIKSKIESAKGLITCLTSDEENLFMTVTARMLNPSLRIVAKSEEEINREKFIRAGASEVVSTTAIGALRMASVMLRPTVVSFLDTMLRETKTVLRIDEVVIPPESKFINSTLAQIDLQNRYNLIILAKKEFADKYIFNPPPNALIQPGDIFIIMGETTKIKELESNL